MNNSVIMKNCVLSAYHMKGKLLRINDNIGMGQLRMDNLKNGHAFALKALIDTPHAGHLNHWW